MKKNAKCTTLAIIGTLAMFGVCIDSLGVALVSMLIAILCFSGTAAIDPKWGLEYTKDGKVVE